MEVDYSLGTLILIPAIAVVAPLLVRGLARWVAIPLVVFEIVLGLLLGPAVLGWIQPGPFAQAFSDFGLALLFFLAGSEIDFRAIRGRPIGRAAIGWIISLAAGVGLAVLFAPSLPAAAFMKFPVQPGMFLLFVFSQQSGQQGYPVGMRRSCNAGNAGKSGEDIPEGADIIISRTCFYFTRPPGNKRLAYPPFIEVSLYSPQPATAIKERRISATLHMRSVITGEYDKGIIVYPQPLQ